MWIYNSLDRSVVQLWCSYLVNSCSPFLLPLSPCVGAGAFPASLSNSCTFEYLQNRVLNTSSNIRYLIYLYQMLFFQVYGVLLRNSTVLQILKTDAIFECLIFS